MIRLAIFFMLISMPPVFGQVKKYDGQVIRVIGPDNRGGVISGLLEKLAKNFTDQYGGRVEILESTMASFAQEGLLDLMGPRLYDGFYGLASERAELRFSGRLLDITDYIYTQQMEWSDIMLYYRQLATDTRGHVVSIPWGGNENMMYFRTDIFERFKLRAPTTFDELMTVVKIINGTDMNGDGVPDAAFCHSSPVLWSQVSLLDHYICHTKQTHGWTTDVWFDAETMKPRVMDQGYTYAIENMKDLYKYAVPYEWWEGAKVNQDEHMFTKRDCAIMFNFQYVMEAYEPNFTPDIHMTFIPGTKYIHNKVTDKMEVCTDVLCPSAINGINIAPWSGGGWGSVISDATKYPEFAFQIMSIIAQPSKVSDTILFDPVRMRLMDPANPIYPAKYPHMKPDHVKGLLANYTKLMKSDNICSNNIIPGSTKYRDAYYKLAHEFFNPAGTMTTAQFQQKWYNDWEVITNQLGRESQISAYRYVLHLPPLVADSTASSTDIGVIVGPIVGTLSFIIVVFLSIMWYQRWELRRKTRDVTHAPKEKVVIIFTDVQNSTVLWQQETKAMRQAMDMHHDTIRRIIAKYKAYEVKTIGDSFMITCQSCDVAVRLANDIQTTFLTLPWPIPILDTADACVRFQDKKLHFKGLRVRIGMDVGTPEVVYDEVSKGYDYYGDVPNIAARVEAIAHGGQTLITKRVFDELSDEVRSECVMLNIGELGLKGIADKQHLYNVADISLPRHFPAPKDWDKSSSASLKSKESAGSGGPKAPEEMTMVQLVQEVFRLRAKQAANIGETPDLTEASDVTE